MVQNLLLNKTFRSGTCQLKTQNCEGYAEALEWHHESYSPNPQEARKLGLGLYVCHACHSTVHFRPNQLSYYNKKTLILARLGQDGRLAAAKGEIDVEELTSAYKPPTRE